MVSTVEVVSPQSAAGQAGADAAFEGRSLFVVNDLSKDEQLYVYREARELKEAVCRYGGPGKRICDRLWSTSTIGSCDNGELFENFRMENAHKCAYLIFMENSTRTKESFRNAAAFHGMKINVFDCASSSFSQGETLTDTIKMLVGYSVDQTLFIIRSKMEGVCRWLELEIGKRYCSRHKLPQASFINAGDGKHEHPTQELLDEYSFLEQQGWKTDSIHLALVGDLFHGRTVHSKADGLCIYDKVRVDLIAPPELQMPEFYVSKMRSQGFDVRMFESIDMYLAMGEIAKIWYFTRLQLERMPEDIQNRSMELRHAVTLRSPDHCSQLEKGTKIYHPLPRDGRNPEIPFDIDDSDLNGWDMQSRNGYFVRTTLLALFGGKLGADFQGNANLDVGKFEIPDTHLQCPNENCVSHPLNGQREVKQFIVNNRCQYCSHFVPENKNENGSDYNSSFHEIKTPKEQQGFSHPVQLPQHA